MHIPDNFLSTPVWLTLDIVAVPAVAFISRRSREQADSSRLPLLGVMGAFVFAAQMINFPVGIGTSGHLVGGTLLACLLGPSAAALVVTSILIVQALIFQDGGVLALGANIFNMAICGVLAGYLPYLWLRRTRWKYPSVFVGGVLSVLASGLLALAELTLSGIRMPRGLLLASVLLFLVNALMEGAITATVLRAVERLNPALTSDTPSPRPARQVLMAFGVSAVVLAAGGILLASAAPDAIINLGRITGISAAAVQPVIHAPLAGYELPALGSGWFSRAAAGLLGLVGIYVFCLAGGYLVSRAKRTYSS